MIQKENAKDKVKSTQSFHNDKKKQKVKYFQQENQKL